MSLPCLVFGVHAAVAAGVASSVAAAASVAAGGQGLGPRSEGALLTFALTLLEHFYKVIHGPYFFLMGCSNVMSHRRFIHMQKSI